jgi:hypothetical protein
MRKTNISHSSKKVGYNMAFHSKQKVLGTLTVMLPFLMVVTGFLTPPDVTYKSILKPVVTEKATDYTYDEDSRVISYNIGGSSVDVRVMTEQDLNNLFPDDSKAGLYSTNPYTYGNWVDPNLGYTPVRFTTFEVTLRNRTFAKMKINPVEMVLLNDLGETLHAFTFSVAAAKYGNSFEDYYRARRGYSGNEYYRYEMRLGMVRGKNYGLDEMVFRGDSYSGLVTFDVLRDEVKRCQLQIKDVAFRFDAFNRPVEVTTPVFNFEHSIEKTVVTQQMKKNAIERQKARIEKSGNVQMVDNRVNDNARSELAVDRMIEQNFAGMEKCFIDRYRRNEVTPGTMVISFNIGIDGKILSQNVIEVEGIKNQNFMNCILGVIKNMKFDAIKDMPLEGTNIVKGPAEPVNVLYPLKFSVYQAE